MYQFPSPIYVHDYWANIQWVARLGHRRGWLQDYLNVIKLIDPSRLDVDLSCSGVDVPSAILNPELVGNIRTHWMANKSPQQICGLCTYRVHHGTLALCLSKYTFTTVCMHDADAASIISVYRSFPYGITNTNAWDMGHGNETAR